MSGIVAGYLNVRVVKIAEEVANAGGFLHTVKNAAPLASEAWFVAAAREMRD